MDTLVSIIIVNFNGAHLITDCLTSVFQQSYKNYEVIVVDNASTDNSLKVLSNYGNITLICLDENKGFTGGNIEGYKKSRGEIIVLLNNDTIVDKNWLKNLITPLKNNNKIGFCASKMLIYGTNQIDSAGDGCTTTGRGFKIGEGELEKHFNKSRYVFGACGGAVAYKKEMLDEIGFLDEDFFLIHEDTDMNFRAQLAGWKCYFIHNAIVYHKVRSSIGVMSEVAIYYSIRNASYVWLKNLPSLLILRYIHHIILQELGTFLFYGLKQKRIKLYIKAKKSIYKNMFNILRKRKAIQNNRRVSIKYISSILESSMSKELVLKKLKKIF